MPPCSGLRRVVNVWLGLVVASYCSGCGSRSSNSQSASTDDESEAARSQILDLADKAVDPFQASDAKASVFIFISNDCPISNRYAPEIRRLCDEFSRQRVAFWLVHPDPDE